MHYAAVANPRTGVRARAPCAEQQADQADADHEGGRAIREHGSDPIGEKAVDGKSIVGVEGEPHLKGETLTWTRIGLEVSD